MWKPLALVILGLLLLVVLPQPLLAASGAEGADHGGGRNMFEKAIDLGIWTLVVFLLLLFILTKFAWRPMLEGLDKREKDIAHAKEEADRAREEAARLRQELQAEMARGQEQIRSIIEEARRDAEVLRETQKAEAAAEIAADRERLRRELNTARDQALRDMWAQSATLASIISSKAIRGNLTPQDHERLVDEGINDLQRVLAERRGRVGTA